MASHVHGRSLWLEVVLMDQADEISEGHMLHLKGCAVVAGSRYPHNEAPPGL